MTYIIAVQPNGEHLRFERWVYMNWLAHSLRDEEATKGLRNAVRIYESYH